MSGNDKPEIEVVSNPDEDFLAKKGCVLLFVVVHSLNETLFLAHGKSS